MQAAIASLHADEPWLHATRGELLGALGRTDDARDACRRALALVHGDAERRLLERRLAELGPRPRERPARERPPLESGR